MRNADKRLLEAIENGDEEGVREALDNGADVNAIITDAEIPVEPVRVFGAEETGPALEATIGATVAGGAVAGIGLATTGMAAPIAGGAVGGVLGGISGLATAGAATAGAQGLASAVIAGATTGALTAGGATVVAAEMATTAGLTAAAATVVAAEAVAGTVAGTVTAATALEAATAAAVAGTTAAGATAGVAAGTTAATGVLTTVLVGTGIALGIGGAVLLAGGIIVGIVVATKKYKERELRSCLEPQDKDKSLDNVKFMKKEKIVNLEKYYNLGITALMLSAMRGNINIVKLLLERGANATITAPNGKTALDYARENNHRNIAMVIRDNQPSDEIRDIQPSPVSKARDGESTHRMIP